MTRVMKWILLGWLCLGTETAWADNAALCYHRFDHSLQDMYSVLPEIFEWQMQYIQEQGIPFIPMRTLVDAYASTSPAIGQSVLVTVDDGWRDVKNILPLAEKYRVPLTLFLYPQVLDHGAYLRFDELESLKKNTLIDFGCHSYTHPVLRRLAPEVLNHEVVESGQELEKRLGRPVDVFAYPFGMFDATSRSLVKARYKLAFGVNDGGNRPSTNSSQLNRFVIYRTTSFGEFMDMASRAKEPAIQPRYSSANLSGGNEGRGFIYTKAQVYRFPPEPLAHAVLIIPSMQIGAAWMHKALEAFNARGIHAYVLVTRNNNIPFYRPDRQIMRDVAAWGLPDYVQDLKTTLAYVHAREASFAVVTWGDGFDWLAAAVSGDSACAEGLSGLIAVNPSVRGPRNDEAFFARERDRLDAMLARGQYTLETMSFYIKMKTLSDLMMVKPDAASPFAQKLGYVKTFTNAQVFHEELSRLDHPELSVDETSEEYDLGNFKGAFMQPLPVFSMVVPVRVRRDACDLWARGFSSSSGTTLTCSNLNFPVSFWDAKNYRQNPARILRTFPGVRLQAEYKLDDESTVEILLSSTAISQMSEELLRFFSPTETSPVYLSQPLSEAKP